MQLLGLVLGIMLLDLTLSGDNALIIAATASTLPRRQQWLAILCGGVGAILLRILLTACASVLLGLSWLQVIGAGLILFVAVRLLMARSIEATSRYRSASRFSSAIGLIVIADLTMSLDNILAVGALAHGNVLALALGLVGSISVLLCGSALIASLMQRLTWLIDVAALVLAWTAAGMLVDSGHVQTAAWMVYAAMLAYVLLADVVLRLLAAQKISFSFLWFKRSKKS